MRRRVDTTVRILLGALFALSTFLPATASAAGLPSGWSSRDIGSVVIAGGADRAGSTLTVHGSGADIWGSEDAFHFVYRTLTGDGEIVVQVSSLENVDRWTKAGVMMRETLSAGSRQALMLVTPGKGLAFQRRRTAWQDSVHTAGGDGTDPYYVRLKRTGKTFTAYRSLDGSTWTLVGSEKISMATTIYVGLAVTAHEASSLATATFDDLSVSTAAADAEPPTPSVPSPPPSDSSSNTPPPAPEPPAPPVPPAPSLPPPSSSSTLRVLHWNVHHGNDPHNKYAVARQAEEIYQARPDIVTLNEVEKNNATYGNEDQAYRIAHYLTSKTGERWYHYMVPSRGGKSGIGNAILSRYPIEATDVCQLSGERNAVHATMVINGRTVNVWSTHLDDESGSQRSREARTLLKCMDRFAEQRFVAGDFNAQQGSAEYNLMNAEHGDGWRTARTTRNFSGNCDGCTRNSRIDYLFVSDGATALRVQSAEIIDTRDSRGVMASDHKPMLTILAIN
jgi:endonuclease/exonuclease/phosphatase family metal-dependent hydrolase